MWTRSRIRERRRSLMSASPGTITLPNASRTVGPTAYTDQFASGYACRLGNSTVHSALTHSPSIRVYAAPRSRTQPHAAARSPTQPHTAPRSRTQPQAAASSPTQPHAAARSPTQSPAAARSPPQPHATPRLVYTTPNLPTVVTPAAAPAVTHLTHPDLLLRLPLSLPSHRPYCHIPL